MGAQSMLEQLLKSGLARLQNSGNPTRTEQQALRGTGSAQASGAGLAQGLQWGQIAAGGAVGGVLGLLVGNKRARKLGGKTAGKVLKYGGVAALGYAAYKTYAHWQAQQAQSGQPNQPNHPIHKDPHGQPHWGSQPAVAEANPWPAEPGLALPAPEQEAHSRVMLMAMVAAAKADGHVDANERGLMESEWQRQGASAADRAWLEQELSRPLDPAEVARAASGPVQAAEMYLASLLVADETSFMERAYLDELARQLKLPEGLKRDLEAQAQSV